MAGCSSQPSTPAQTEKPQPKAAELQTGRYAFQKLYVSARGWARDAQPYRLESQPTADSKGKDGKSDVWHASFASPAGTWREDLCVVRHRCSGCARARNHSRHRGQLQSHQFVDRRFSMPAF